MGHWLIVYALVFGTAFAVNLVGSPWRGGLLGVAITIAYLIGRRERRQREYHR